MSAEVYTSENYGGDKFSLNEGEFNTETSGELTIIGVIANQEYPQTYKVDKHTYFKNDSINSLIINPHTKMVVFEEADKGGKWVVFENSTDGKMEVPSLKFANFDNKISSVEISEIKDKSKKYQSTKILEAEDKETFNSVERYNLNVLMIIILCVIGMFCFVIGGVYGGSVQNLIHDFVDF